MRAQKAEELFCFIAKHVTAFLKEHHPEKLNCGEILNLGFSFSFPCYQTSLKSGVLLRWTKGFDIDDAVGKDVGYLLQAELDKLKIPVRVTAIVNDALGTIMSRAYTVPPSKARPCIGAIFGTGTNGVYLEKLSAISKDIGPHDRSTGEMFLSAEWGSLDNKLAVLSNTQYDQLVNDASINKDNQIFEKRVSGMFLGELLRTAIELMYENHADQLFANFRGSSSSLKIHTRWSVDASILSVAECDGSASLDLLRAKIADEFGFPLELIMVNDAIAVQKVARAIGKRAARLAGAAVGSVILQSGRLNCMKPLRPPTAWEEIGVMPDDTGLTGDIDEVQIVDVAVDGSVVELYPDFEHYMRQALRAIKGIGSEGERRIRIGLTKDGSSVGTAIIALLAAHQEDSKNP